MKGFIYIMRNPCFKKALLKIGRTKNIKNRLKQASGTNVPDDYILEACYEVKDMDAAERDVFSILSEYRYKENKEFFEIELDYAKFICDNVVNSINNNSKFSISPISDEDLDKITNKF